METGQPPRPPRRSHTAEATRDSLVERAWARTPEERIVLALQLGERCRLLALARSAPQQR